MRGFLVGFVLLLVLPVYVDAEVYHVGPTQDYDTIQDAVDAASPGDVILVHEGTYHESITIRKGNLTIEGFNPLNPPVIDGADQEFAQSSHVWTHVQGNIYKTPYTWYTYQISDEDFSSNQGIYRGTDGIYRAPMHVYEDDTLLRGYRNKHDPDYWYGEIIDQYPYGFGGAYRTLDELNPQNDDGSLPQSYKKDIRIPGRFLYNESSHELFVWGAQEDHPSNHSYHIPVIMMLIWIDAPYTTIKNLVIKHAAGYALLVEDADYSIIEDNYFINNIPTILIKRSPNVTIRNNFIQTKGFWQRYWYDDCKNMILWTHPVTMEYLGDTRGCQIYKNMFYGSYSAFLAPSRDMQLHDNIISHVMSTHISMGYYVDPEPYNMRIYNNIFHHTDQHAIGLGNMPFGPVWVYRNLFYNCNYFNRDGGNTFEASQGKAYFYHNTIALSRGISHHPGLYPSYKNTFYRNNIYYLKYTQAYERYWNYHSHDPAYGWSYFPFENGPDSDYNLYWEVDTYDGSEGIAYFYTTESGKQYSPGEFGLMQQETGLDPNGREEDPLFINREEFINLDVSNLKYDNFSDMDYRDVIAGGYENLFDMHFSQISDVFELSQNSPAINNGVNLPADWLDTVEVSDGMPDIGVYEYTGEKIECYQDSDCGTEPCKVYICNNPGTPSASCSSQDITSCINDDDCCPSGCTEQNDNDCINPVALYHFDEGSGTTTADSSGYGNDGTVYGATWTTGISGKALEFDGVDDYIDCGTDESLILYNQSYTISAWVKSADMNQNWQTIYTTDPSSVDGFRLFVHGSKIYYYTYINGTDLQTLWSDTLNQDQWYYVVITRDYGSGDTKLYVNGTVEDNFTAIGYCGRGDISNRYHRISNSGNTFNGTIDEVKIYNHTLTEEEILEHYNKIKADLNNDGYVDILDLGIIAGDFGKTTGFNPKADVVPNGEIDVFDVVFVASRFT
jgi:hypothetical protein